jgi:hypothetical protein
MCSMVSISKGGGGGGGRGSWMTPSQRPCRRRKNSISSRRRILRTGFMVPLQQGHWSGSPPHTLRMMSRQRGRMSRADCLGGPGMRRIWAGGGFSRGVSGWDGRMKRSGIGEIGPGICWSRGRSSGRFAGLSVGGMQIVWQLELLRHRVRPPPQPRQPMPRPDWGEPSCASVTLKPSRASTRASTATVPDPGLPQNSPATNPLARQPPCNHARCVKNLVANSSCL